MTIPLEKISAKLAEIKKIKSRIVSGSLNGCTAEELFLREEERQKKHHKSDFRATHGI